MKILMVCSSFGIGGAETHVLELSLELSKRGHDISVVSYGGEYTKKLKENNIRHYKVNLTSKNPCILLTSYKNLKKIIENGKYDVVHSHARLPSFLCNAICKKYSTPFVTTAHWVFENNFYKKGLTRWGEYTLAVSEDIKEYLKKEYKIKDENIKVTHNGIDTSKFLPGAKKAKQIVCVTRIDKGRAKSAFALVKIAPKIYNYDKNIEIVIIGGGNLEGQLINAINDANKKCRKNVVKFLGRKTNVENFLSSCDIFVGVSRAALEGMSCACAVILAGDEGYSGIFSHKKANQEIHSNFCCRGNEEINETKLFNDIITLLSYSNEKRSDIGKENRSFVEENYSIAKMANDAEESYKKTISMHKKRILICGYYGYGNIGDDITLSCVINLLKSNEANDITVMSSKPKNTEKAFGVNSVHRYNIPKILFCLKKCDFFMLGGGNLLQNQTSDRSLLYYGLIARLAHLFNCHCIAFSTGIGELYGEWARHFAKKTLSFFEEIHARTIEDFKRIKSEFSFANCVSSADFGFLYNTKSNCVKSSANNYFLISIRDPKKDRKQFVESITFTINKITSQTSLSPYFIVMHPQKDEKITKAVANKCANSKIYSNISIDTFVSLLKNADFSIGMRLHMMIMSVRCGTPHLCIPYDTKCKDMLKHIQQTAKANGIENTHLIAQSSVNTLYSDIMKIKKEPKNKKSYETLNDALSNGVNNFKNYIEKILLV